MGVFFTIHQVRGSADLPPGQVLVGKVGLGSGLVPSYGTELRCCWGAAASTQY